MNRTKRTAGSLCVLTALFLVGAAPRSASAQAVPPDEVRTADGGVYRGVIIENVPGDHLTILLPSGESRRIPAADVVSTGVVMPAESAAPTPSTPSPSERPPLGSGESVGNGVLRIEVASATPGLTLHGSQGTSASLQRICYERCELRMNPGLASFAVQDHSGQLRRVAGPIALDQSGRLDFGVHSRRNARIGVGVTGVSFALLSLVFFLPDRNHEYFYATAVGTLKDKSFAGGMGLLATGVIFIGTAVAVRDNGRVRFTPYGGSGTGGLRVGGSF